MSTQPRLEVLDVYRHPLDPRLLGAWLEAPAAGDALDAYFLALRGWALGRHGWPVEAIEIHQAGVVCWRSKSFLHRPDIAVAFPAAHAGGESGFWAYLSAARFPKEFELEVRAVVQGEAGILIARLRLRRREFTTEFEPRFHPLMISTLGRSGSTWVTAVLGQHPAILAYRPFQYEPRVAGYWLEIFRTLAGPASAFQSLAGDLSDEHWWIGGPASTPVQYSFADPPILAWLGGDTLEATLEFGRRRIDEFYGQIAALQARPGAMYFTEKCWPGSFTPTLVTDLYPRSRELLLVRDFRDMVCSVLAFNRKSGVASFGRERTDDDVQFIHQLRESALALRKVFRAKRPSVRLVRYEDFILRPEPTLRSILDHLELKSTAELVAQMLAQAATLSPELQTKHLTSADPAASIGRWRRDLTPAMQAACHEAFADILAEFGYET